MLDIHIFDEYEGFQIINECIKVLEILIKYVTILVNTVGAKREVESVPGVSDDVEQVFDGIGEGGFQPFNHRF